MPSDRRRSGPTLRAHGGPIAEELARLGLARGDLVDFSVNVNPYGPAPEMLEAIRGARVDVYPDPTSFEARVALAEAAGVGADRVVVGDGAADLLWTLAQLLVGRGRAALIVEPTFSEFRAATETAGGRIIEWRAPIAPDLAPDAALDVGAVVTRAQAGEVSALYLCTPNNPTGTGLRAAGIAALADALPDVTLVVDQAFLSLSEHHADAGVDLPPNVVRVRSLTKEHAIPGVRVGYLIATPALAAAVEAARPAWSTSAAAQAAAIASVALGPFVAESRDRLLADRRALVAGLREIGRAPRPTCATFCMVDVGDAGRLRAALLARHRIMIRDCASFEMPGYARLGARPAADRQRLLAALREELGHC